MTLKRLVNHSLFCTFLAALFVQANVASADPFRQTRYPNLIGPGRSSFGCGRSLNKVFVIGGHIGPEHQYPPEAFSDRTEYFDLETGSWFIAAPKTTPTQGFGIATHGKYIYAFGGFAYSAAYNPRFHSLDIIERYDVEQNKWTTLPTKLPRARSSNVVAQIGNLVFLIGGWDATPQFDGDAKGRFIREIDIFDLDTESFVSTTAVLPDPLRRAFTHVVLNDEIILLGGLGAVENGSPLLDKVTAYNPKTNTWRELAPLPFATFAPAAGVLKDDIFLFGGFSFSGRAPEYVGHIYQYTGAANIWAQSNLDLFEPKAFVQVVDFSERELGLLGGHNAVSGSKPVLTFEGFSTD